MGLDGRLTYVSSRATPVLGFAPGDVLGVYYPTLALPDDHDVLATAIAIVAAGAPEASRDTSGARQRGTLPRQLDAGLESGEQADVVGGDERHLSNTSLRDTSGNCRQTAPIVNGRRRGGNCFQNALTRLDIPSARDHQGWATLPQPFHNGATAFA